MSSRVRASAVAVRASRGTSGMLVEQALELAVVGPEIVPPFADAMRFVDRDQRQFDAIDANGGTPSSVARSGAT